MFSRFFAMENDVQDLEKLLCVRIFYSSGMLSAVCLDQGMTKLMEEEIQPILVPAVLEHEGISGISGGDKPRLES